MPYLALCFDAAAGDAERWTDALLEAGAFSVDASGANAGTEDETARFGERNRSRSGLRSALRGR
jgi:hypothetical protein